MGTITQFYGCKVTVSRQLFSSPRWIVNAPHCWLLAWKLLPSTWRYLVLTVCDLSLLNNAT